MSLLTDLVSYYKLDESSGNAADSVGSNTGVMSGTYSYGAGKINNALTMASGSYLKASISSGLSGSFSVSGW
ncbi:MAG: hypothetical protein PF488_03985 [Patescibacteria group bacterium]|jgi:hypothetical protein|nr:hypothetical protein [Patescibacteria group bacterium]